MYFKFAITDWYTLKLAYHLNIYLTPNVSTYFELAEKNLSDVSYILYL